MKVEIKYLRERTNRDGTKRYYWVPSKKLQDAGWAIVPLPPGEALAIDKAKEQNAKLDRWYHEGRPKLATAAPDVAPDGSRPRGSVWQLIDTYRKPVSKHADPEADPDDERVFGYDYNELAPATKRSYDDALDFIGKWLGPLMARKVTENIIIDGLKAISRQRHASGPHAGRRKVATAMLIGRVGRMLFHASRTLFDPTHACYVKKAENPWAGLRAREKRQKPTLWTREGRDLFVAAAIKLEWMSVAAAVRINWWMGQREGDVLRLGHNFNPGDVIEVVQSKTAGSVYLPVEMVPEIAEVVDELRADQRRRMLSGVHLLIDERNGLTWTEDRFRKAFQEIRVCAVEEARWCIRNNVPGWEGRDDAWVDKTLTELTFMRLRHTVVTMLFEAGCEIAEVVAITGHTIQSAVNILERYGQRTRKTASNAFRKRVESEGK